MEYRYKGERESVLRSIDAEFVLNDNEEYYYRKLKEFRQTRFGNTPMSRAIGMVEFIRSNIRDHIDLWVMLDCVLDELRHASIDFDVLTYRYMEEGNE